MNTVGCAELIRERPVEAHVDPLFAVLTEPQAGQLYARAFQGWLQEALANPPDGVRRALRRTGAPIFQGAGDGDGPVDRLRRAGRALAEWRDFPAPWRRPAFDRAAAGSARSAAQLPASAKRRCSVATASTSTRTRCRRAARSNSRESFGQVDLDGGKRGWSIVRDRCRARARAAAPGAAGDPRGCSSARDALLPRCRLSATRTAPAACLQRELAGRAPGIRT